MSTSDVDSDQLTISQALEAYKFFEEAAGSVKNRTWTISAWVLSLDSGLLGYIFKLVGEKGGDKLLPGIACGAGLVLTAFLIILVLDQGRHLKEYWARQELSANRRNPLRKDFRKVIGDLDKSPNNGEKQKKENKKSNGISLLIDRLPDQKDMSYKTGKPIPSFCSSLIVLATIYCFGFIFSLIYVLVWCCVDVVQRI